MFGKVSGKLQLSAIQEYVKKNDARYWMTDRKQRPKKNYLKCLSSKYQHFIITR